MFSLVNLIKCCLGNKYEWFVINYFKNNFFKMLKEVFNYFFL